MAKKEGLLAKSLGASASAQAKTKQARLLKSATRTSRDYVEGIEKQLDDLNGQRDEIMEVSAGIDMNAGMKGVTNGEMDDKVKLYHQLTLKIKLKEKELEASKLAHSELVGEEEE